MHIVLCAGSDDIDLTTILCIKEQRIASDGSGFSYGGRYYQLMKNDKRVSVSRKAKITVMDSHKHGLRAQYNGTIYETNLLTEKPLKKPIEKPRNDVKVRQSTPPTEDHPWKMPKEKRPKPYYDESDREVLDALFDSSRAWGGTTIDTIISR